MPKTFRFLDHDTNKVFTCKLLSVQCGGTTKQGRRCKRKVVSSLPLCWNHLESMKNLKIKDSTIPNAGKGLFAFDRKKKANDIIFKPRDLVIEYTGEIIDDDEIQDRYGDKTAVYGLKMSDDCMVDAACERSAGALANHKQQRYANAELTTRTINGIIKPFLVAIKRIRNGQEVTVNYGRDYRFGENVTTSTK